jgi:hypothetical protein
MQETKRAHLFDIKSIISDVEKVIQKGLNKMLDNYIERHEMLEKTHQQLMQLPSIVEELNRRNRPSLKNDSEDEDETEYLANNNNNIINEQISNLESKLQKMEKKYDTIIPILDKLVFKITELNADIKSFKSNETTVLIHEDIQPTYTIEKSSVVKTSENENIEIHIQESEELKEEDFSDDEDANPLLVTCSTITLNHEIVEEKTVEHEPLQEETVEQESVEEESVEQEVIEEESVEQEPAEEVTVEKESVEQESVEQESVEQESVEQESAEEESVEEESVEEESAEEVTVEQESVEEESVEQESAEEVTVEEETVEEESVEQESVEEESAEEETEDTSVETETKEIKEDDDESSVETETKEELVEVEEEDEEIFEIDIDDKTYCTNNEINGFIWELTEDGEQGEKVGYFKECEPFFYAEEN